MGSEGAHITGIVIILDILSKPLRFVQILYRHNIQA
jgi:hypothetical protein